MTEGTPQCKTNIMDAFLTVILVRNLNIFSSLFSDEIYLRKSAGKTLRNSALFWLSDLIIREAPVQNRFEVQL